MGLRVPLVTSYARAPSSLLFLRSALPTNSSLFEFFARIFANAPTPHESLRTCFICATQAHFHFCPQHWLLCHLGLYSFEFEFEFAGLNARVTCDMDSHSQVLPCLLTAGLVPWWLVSYGELKNYKKKNIPPRHRL